MAFIERCSGRFVAILCGAFMIIGNFFGWVIGKPVLPLANKTAVIGFAATLLISITTAYLLTKPKSATK